MRGGSGEGRAEHLESQVRSLNRSIYGQFIFGCFSFSSSETLVGKCVHKIVSLRRVAQEERRRGSRQMVIEGKLFSLSPVPALHLRLPGQGLDCSKRERNRGHSRAWDSFSCTPIAVHATTLWHYDYLIYHRNVPGK